VKFAPRHACRLERNTPTINAYGEQVPDWGLVAEVYADLSQVSGTERARAQQIHAEATWRAYIRYAPGLTIHTADRLVYGDRSFEIVAVIDQHEHHRIIKLELKEQVPA
jgi:SPP1 family predicted phage head-tail adaptor